MGKKPHKYNTINWDEIQNEYNKGLFLRDLLKKYHLTYFLIYKAKKDGLFITKTRSEGIKEARRLKPLSYKPTEETKKKISQSRTKYLLDNPDKVPYRLNHSSKESYPEMIFRNALESSGIIGWKQHFQNSIYEYDFAFPEKKIDIEIDGSTHKLERVRQIDERRDLWSKSQGWIVIRFDAQTVKKDVVSCINILKAFL